MSKIRIKNFGPIRDGFVDNDGWMDVKKVTVLIGNQGSGKSTVAKLISIFSWLEKDLFRTGGFSLKFHQQEGTFKHRLEYHRIEKYLNNNTEILYNGDAYNLTYKAGQNLDIQEISDNNYTLPKITYFPAERNFVSSVKTINEGKYLRLWSQSLQEFKEIFQEAKVNFKDRESHHLPISNVDIEYNRLNDILYVKGNDYKIPLSDTASGFQSYIPLFVVANYVSGLLKSGQEMREDHREYFKKQSAAILNNDNYTEEQKRILLSNIAAQFNIKRIFNIIEEPEQNLFPTSQQGMLNKLLEFNNNVKGNNLIITTHSPYIIGYLTLAIKADELYRKTKKQEIIKQINEIVPQKSAVNHQDVIIYELDENDGTIRKLGNYKGIPLSKNYLNSVLAEKNELYSNLLDIEDEL